MRERANGGEKIMKKRILATIMTLTLGAAMLTACGSKADETSTNETNVVDTTVPSEETQAPSTEEPASCLLYTSPSPRD